MLARIRRLWNHSSDDGASAVEYGLLVAAIAAVIAVVVFALGTTISRTFHHTCQQVDAGKTAVQAATDCGGAP